MSSLQIRLMIADDHAIMREGLRQLFALTTDIHVVAEAGDGPATIEGLRHDGIDLLLLDMNMPGLSGEDLIARARAHHPTLPILVLSMHNEPQIAQRALRAGASGYVAKDRDSDTILVAVRRVASGGRYIDPVLAEQMAFDVSGGNPPPNHALLSTREFQIMRLLASGHTVSSIANDLVISHKTVSTHKARMMEKMNFASNADLVRYAIGHGLID